MRDRRWNVGIFGLYHLGAVTAVQLAMQGHRVLVSDHGARTRELASLGRLEIQEPGLNAAFASAVATGQITVVEAAQLITESDVVWIAVDTPMREDNSADLTEIDAFVDLLARLATQPLTVLISSQIPVGTTTRYQEDLGPSHAVAYLPENLRMGRAMTDFAETPLVVVGTESAQALDTVRELLPGRELRVGSLETAELTKHATNALLAQLITFGNRIGDIARAVGANGYEVEQNLRADARFGLGLPLRPGARFAGGTLEREIRCLQDVSSDRGLDRSWLDALLDYNSARVGQLLTLLSTAVEQPLRKVLLLGWLYKPDSTSARDAPGRHWALEMERRGIAWSTMEPLLSDKSRAQFLQVEDLGDALRECDAVVVVRPDVCNVSQFVELMQTCKSTPVLDCWRWLNGYDLSVIEPGRPS